MATGKALFTNRIMLASVVMAGVAVADTVALWPMENGNLRCAIDPRNDLVDAGMQVTRLLVNNMREITAEDARAIYERVLQ